MKSLKELIANLQLARIHYSPIDPPVFVRLINGEEVLIKSIKIQGDNINLREKVILDLGG